MKTGGAIVSEDSRGWIVACVHTGNGDIEIAVIVVIPPIAGCSAHGRETNAAIGEAARPIVVKKLSRSTVRRTEDVERPIIIIVPKTEIGRRQAQVHLDKLRRCKSLVRSIRGAQTV